MTVHIIFISLEMGERWPQFATGSWTETWASHFRGQKKGWLAVAQSAEIAGKLVLCNFGLVETAALIKCLKPMGHLWWGGFWGHAISTPVPKLTNARLYTPPHTHNMHLVIYKAHCFLFLTSIPMFNLTLESLYFYFFYCIHHLKHSLPVLGHISQIPSPS